MTTQKADKAPTKAETTKPAQTPPDAGGAGGSASSPPAAPEVSTASSSSSNADDEARVQALQEEQRRKEVAEKEATISTLRSEVSGLQAKVTGLEKEKAALLDRAEKAEKECEQLRSKLQQEKVGTLDLEKGQAQLTESVTFTESLNKTRVSGKLGDVVIRNGTKTDVQKTQDKVGGRHLVYALSAAEFDEIVQAKLATARL